MKTKSFLGVGALCLFLVVVAPRMAQKQTSAEALAGLWGVEQNLGPQVRGELILDARGPEWRAQIAGFRTRKDAPWSGSRKLRSQVFSSWATARKGESTD